MIVSHNTHIRNTQLNYTFKSIVMLCKCGVLLKTLPWLVTATIVCTFIAIRNRYCTPNMLFSLFMSLECLKDPAVSCVCVCN